MVEYLNTSEIHFNHDVADRDSLDEASDGESDGSNEEYSPYSVEDLAAIFTEFYKFLTTLHYDPADLKMPPPEGWSIDIFPKAIVDSKSDDVVELMRRLPYFKENEKSTHVHYKSKLIAFPDDEQHGTLAMYEDHLEDVHDEFYCGDGKLVDHKHLLVFAGGYESGGHTFILDVLHGEITADIIRYETREPAGVEAFFDSLSDDFEQLRLIPCPGRETKEAGNVPERSEEISEDEVRSQTEKWYPGTDLDWQFVRQVYRNHGWPDDFRRQEAVSFIEDFMAMHVDQRDEWEKAYR